MNEPHQPNKVVFLEPNPTAHQLVQEAKLNTDTKVRVLANQYLVTQEIYEKWWKGVVIEQN